MIILKSRLPLYFTFVEYQAPAGRQVHSKEMHNYNKGCIKGRNTIHEMLKRKFLYTHGYSYAKKKKEAEQPLFLWYNEACKTRWKNSNELNARFRNTSVISGKRIVFNVHGNKYRLIVDIEYFLQIIFIVWIGTHAEYDKIDAKTIVYDKTR